MLASGSSVEALVNLASRKRCDLTIRKSCDFYFASPEIRRCSAIFWRYSARLCDLKIQGPLNGGGGFPIWARPSFFCPFWDFPDFSGFSRFARGWSRDIPDSSLFSFSAY